jgi:putative nucleotidyltransferase with HDIG domain
MMSRPVIDQNLVIQKAVELPGFPRIVSAILDTIDDPDANFNILTHLIEHDPVIAARVLAVANAAAERTRRPSAIRDIYAAASMIGIGRVRSVALIGSCVDFFDKIGAPDQAATFWQHSVAVGICAEEIALHMDHPISASAALIAGLLHDIGQLWLYRFDRLGFRSAWQGALTHGKGIDITEREQFGVDHTVVGAWLAEHWGLPPSLVAAIRGHHHGDSLLDEPLVAVTHVAEVLSNALDLTGRKENRVTQLSATACNQLGLAWDEHSRQLFGRIDARSRHANTFFA